jgi:hypothetical protein
MREILQGEAVVGPTWSADSKYVYLTGLVELGSGRRDLLRVDVMHGGVDKLRFPGHPRTVVWRRLGGAFKLSLSSKVRPHATPLDKARFRAIS